MEILNIIFRLIWFIILERLLFIITAKICAKKCNYNCEKCKHWACTYKSNSNYKDLIIRDYSKYCGKIKKPRIEENE